MPEPAVSLHNLPDLRHGDPAATGRNGTPSVARGARLKLHYQAPSNFNAVTAYGPGYIEINRVRHEWSDWGAVLLAPEAAVQSWPVEGPAELQEAHLEAIVALGPEIVLFGTGSRQRFPRPAALAPLVRAQVGFEVMDTAAACRTFNILVAEGRRVVGAFFPPDDPQA